MFLFVMNLFEMSTLSGSKQNVNKDTKSSNVLAKCFHFYQVGNFFFKGDLSKGATEKAVEKSYTDQAEVTQH